MIWKRIFIGLIIVLVVIQFFRPTRNQAAAPSDNDINRKYTVPENVSAILQRSCYDCHSNTTVYPWYANVQPVAWWLDNHIRNGKRKLNFSEFLGYPLKRQDHKLEELIEMIDEREMPLKSYLLIHRTAKLSADQVKLLKDWANGLRTDIQAEMQQEVRAGI